MPSRLANSWSERARPVASSSNHARPRAIPLISAGSHVELCFCCANPGRTNLVSAPRRVKATARVNSTAERGLLVRGAGVPSPGPTVYAALPSRPNRHLDRVGAHGDRSDAAHIQAIIQRPAFRYPLATYLPGLYVSRGLQLTVDENYFRSVSRFTVLDRPLRHSWHVGTEPVGACCKTDQRRRDMSPTDPLREEGLIEFPYGSVWLVGHS